MPLHDLSDVTFIVPIFIDCPERLRNLQSNLRHLTALFDTSILIGEMTNPDEPPIDEELTEFSGRFQSLRIDNKGQDFHRTHLLNRLLQKVETPLVCNLDCDAVFSTNQYLKAVQLLRWNLADFVLPYRDSVVHIAAHNQAEFLTILKERIPNEAEIQRLAEEVWTMDSVGGAILGKTQNYRNCGGENEHFIGWGWEDNERMARFEKLGCKTERLAGSFYHLNHPRGETSSQAHANYEANRKEFERIAQMTRPELELEISQWLFRS